MARYCALHIQCSHHELRLAPCVHMRSNTPTCLKGRLSGSHSIGVFVIITRHWPGSKVMTVVAVSISETLHCTRLEHERYYSRWGVGQSVVPNHAGDQ